MDYIEANHLWKHGCSWHNNLFQVSSRWITLHKKCWILTKQVYELVIDIMIDRVILKSWGKLLEVVQLTKNIIFFCIEKLCHNSFFQSYIQGASLQVEHRLSFLTLTDEFILPIFLTDLFYVVWNVMDITGSELNCSPSLIWKT